LKPKKRPLMSATRTAQRNVMLRVRNRVLYSRIYNIQFKTVTTNDTKIYWCYTTHMPVPRTTSHED